MVVEKKPSCRKRPTFLNARERFKAGRAWTYLSLVPTWMTINTNMRVYARLVAMAAPSRPHPR
jgi:hypothetical protein